MGLMGLMGSFHMKAIGGEKMKATTLAGLTRARLMRIQIGIMDTSFDKVHNILNEGKFYQKFPDSDRELAGRGGRVLGLCPIIE